MWGNQERARHPAQSMRITQADEAITTAEAITQTMEQLINTVRLESDLIRAGKMDDAFAISDKKAMLSTEYVKGMTILRDNALAISRYAPVQVDLLRRMHETFRAELQVNMAALATAKTISENLIRGANQDVQNRTTPNTYGQSGTMAKRQGTLRQGISVNQNL